MATERTIRVSDADRDAVAAQLREHYAQGRLTQEELNERLDRTFASRTNLELAAVTSDLPYAAPRGVLPSDSAGPGGSGQWGRGWSGQNWAGPAWGGRSWGGPGGDRGHEYWHRGRGKSSLLGLIPLMFCFWCLIVLLGVMGFGLGSGPSIVVIVLGALAVLRRLIGFGRRRTVRARRGRRRCW
jgi:Domain of unknown function (DUF1707)